MASDFSLCHCKKDTQCSLNACLVPFISSCMHRLTPGIQSTSACSMKILAASVSFNKLITLSDLLQTSIMMTSPACPDMLFHLEICHNAKEKIHFVLTYLLTLVFNNSFYIIVNNILQYCKASYILFQKVTAINSQCPCPPPCFGHKNKHKDIG